MRISGGELLELSQCEAIVQSYGIPWSADMARPVRLSEVWTRMLRNLANCHEQVGDYGALRTVRAMLQCNDATDPEMAAAAVPFLSEASERQQANALDSASSLQQQQQQQLLRMLQVLRLQQQPS